MASARREAAVAASLSTAMTTIRRLRNAAVVSNTKRLAADFTIARGDGIVRPFARRWLGRPFVGATGEQVLVRPAHRRTTLRVRVATRTGWLGRTTRVPRIDEARRRVEPPTRSAPIFIGTRHGANGPNDPKQTACAVSLPRMIEGLPSHAAPSFPVSRRASGSIAGAVPDPPCKTLPGCFAHLRARDTTHRALRTRWFR